MRTCGAPLNVHIQRLHIINCKKKLPFTRMGVFYFSRQMLFEAFKAPLRCPLDTFWMLWANQTLLNWAEREGGLVSNNGAVSMKL